MFDLVFVICFIVFVILWLYGFINTLVIYFSAKKYEPEFFEKNIKSTLFQNKFTVFWKLMRKKKYSEFKNKWLAKKVKITNIIGKLFIAFFIITLLLLVYSWAHR